MKKDKGFTLVELIVVIVIISVLVGVTVLGVTKWVGTARRNQDLNNAESIESLLNAQFISGDYWNSDKWRKDSARSGVTMKGNNALPDINDGNSVYIVKWNQATHDSFASDQNYGRFDTEFYRCINCQQNRAWFIWTWLVYDSTWSGIPTQCVIDGIPVAQQKGHCFYIFFYFDEQGFAKKCEVICAPDNIQTFTWNVETAYNNIMAYKVNNY